MPFTFNGNTPANIVYNGNDLMRLVYNGVTVWEKTADTKVTLYPTDSYYCSGSNTKKRGETIYSPSNGYGRIEFPPHGLFASFTKVTLHIYFTTTASQTACRISSNIGSWTPGSYETSIGNYVALIPKVAGWYEVDITEKVQTVLESNADLPTVGLNIHLRKSGTQVSSHTGEFPPYIVLEKKEET